MDINASNILNVGRNVFRIGFLRGVSRERSAARAARLSGHRFHGHPLRRLIGPVERAAR